MKRILALIILACWTAQAATYYVSTSGSDSRSTAEAQNIATPWRTIKKGVDNLAGGDTLILRGGNYDEPAFSATLIKSGPSPTARTIIKSYPGERAVFRPTHHGTSSVVHAIGHGSIMVSNIVFDGWTIDGTLKVDGDGGVAQGDFIKLPARNMMLTNMWFINQPWGNGVTFTHAGAVGDTSRWTSNAHIVSCTFSNWTYAGVDIRPAAPHPIYTWNLWHSIIENNTFESGYFSAIQYGSTVTNYSASDLIIRNNWIKGGTRPYRVGIYNNTSQSPSTNIWIYNNIVDVSMWGIYLSSFTNHVYNNTVYYRSGANSSARGIWPATRGPHYIANNIVWGIPTTSSGAHTILSGTYATAFLSNNIAGPKSPSLTVGTITQSSPFYGSAYDPQFIDAPTDLRFGQDSPARANGITLSSVFTTDHYGNTRTAPWDIGAFIFNSQAPEEEEPPITDPDPLPLVSPSQSGPAYELGPIAGTFTITRAGSTSGALDIVFAMSGTAVSNVNYTLDPVSPVTIADGQESTTVTLTPINLATIGSQTAILTIQADADYTVSSVNAATMEILGSGIEQRPFRISTGTSGAARMR